MRMAYEVVELPAAHGLGTPYFVQFMTTGC